MSRESMVSSGRLKVPNLFGRANIAAGLKPLQRQVEE
jgi:hypothetical protein